MPDPNALPPGPRRGKPLSVDAFWDIEGKVNVFKALQQERIEAIVRKHQRDLIFGKEGSSMPDPHAKPLTARGEPLLMNALQSMAHLDAFHRAFQRDDFGDVIAYNAAASSMFATSAVQLEMEQLSTAKLLEAIGLASPPKAPRISDPLRKTPAELSDEDLFRFRNRLQRFGVPADDIPDDMLRAILGWLYLEKTVSYETVVEPPMRPPAYFRLSTPTIADGRAFINTAMS